MAVFFKILDYIEIIDMNLDVFLEIPTTDLTTLGSRLDGPLRLGRKIVDII